MLQEKPNILFIMADDHAANAISSYESRLAKVFSTPNIDKIGKEGAVLRNCHCTNALCTPSRATILTGQYCHTNGVKTLNDPLDIDRNTFPQMMQNHGYQTAVVGKWHVHTEPQGFDFYDVLSGQGLYFDPYFLDQDTDWSLIPENDFNARQGNMHQGYVTDIITNKCLEWLDNRDKSKPFMMMCHHKAPHDNFEYHPRYENMFEGVEIPEPETLWEDKSHRSVATREYGTTISEENKVRNAVKSLSSDNYPTGALDLTGLDEVERTKAAYQKYLKDYLRVVKGIDDSVGELLDYLNKENLMENTIIIYTSDQGMFLGEHNYIDKRWIFEESLQMPFLIKYPKEIKSNTVIDDIVTNVDFAPTLLDYIGLNKTDEMQGRSFREVLKGNTPDDWSNRVYYRYWMHMAHHHNPAHYGIRTKQYKLIFFYGLPLDATGALPDNTPPGWELYDLKNDPFECKNVYSDPAYVDVISELKEQLFRMKHELGDDDIKYPELVKRVKQTS